MTNCHYSVVRYVPDDLRDESINVGVIIQDDSQNCCRAGFASSSARASCIDPVLERSSVEQIVRSSKRRLLDLCERHNLSEIIRFYAGGRIRLTPPRFCRTDDVGTELNQLKQSFLVVESSQRELGHTERRLVQTVREDLKTRLQKFPDDVIRFRKKSTPILYEGKRGQHDFDVSFKSPKETDLIRCISFDVKGYAEKVNEAKILSFDEQDIREAHQGAKVNVLAVLFPPRQSQNGTAEAFRLAANILSDHHIPAYDFSLDQDRESLTKIARARIDEAVEAKSS